MKKKIFLIFKKKILKINCILTTEAKNIAET